MSAGSPKRKSVFQGNVRMCMTWSGDTFFFIVVHIYDMSNYGGSGEAKDSDYI